MKDYKIHCFNGEQKITLVCSNRFSKEGLREDFFDEKWNHLPMQRPGNPNSVITIKKPNNYEQMKNFAKTLAQNTSFLRVDFYEINGKLYFVEITFYPSSGFALFEPNIWDFKLGKWLEL